MPLLPVDDLAIHFRVVGRGPPLLLLHGLGSTGDDWRAVAPLLSGFQLFIPDARGHGDTSKPARRSPVLRLAEDVAAFCAALDLKDVHVVGLSMGGMTGLQLAISRPDLVKSLVVVNAGPAMVPRGLAQWALIGVRLVLTVLFGPKRLAPLVAKKLFPNPGQEALRDEVTTRIGANDPAAYRRASLGLLGWSVRDRLHEVRCPVLVVSGDRDYTSVADKEAWVQQIDGARLEVIADSGHGTPGDQPEALARAIQRFVVAVDSGGRTDPVR